LLQNVALVERDDSDSSVSSDLSDLSDLESSGEDEENGEQTSSSLCQCTSVTSSKDTQTCQLGSVDECNMKLPGQKAEFKRPTIKVLPDISQSNCISVVSSLCDNALSSPSCTT
jgi:hypothetical protein